MKIKDKITIEQKSPGFNYAQEQERTLRQALGNELYELLNRIAKPLNYKVWWDHKGSLST